MSVVGGILCLHHIGGRRKGDVVEHAGSPKASFFEESILGFHVLPQGIRGY